MIYSSFVITFFFPVFLVALGKGGIVAFIANTYSSPQCPPSTYIFHHQVQLFH